MKWIILAVALAMVFAMMPISYAWGIAYGGTEIIAKEGQQTQYYLNLQNMEEKTYEIAINIAEGKEIASVSESIVTLQPNSKHTIYVNIDVPEEAKKSYDVALMFRVKGTGSIQLSEEREFRFHVTVEEGKIEKPQSDTSDNHQSDGKNVEQINKIAENNNQMENGNETISLITEQVEQSKPVPAVPTEEPKNNETKEEKAEDNSWIWIVVVIIIIIIIAYLWRSGWI